MGVTNCWSPNVSKPEIVLDVIVKGNASTNPKFELRASVKCKLLALGSTRLARAFWI